MQSEIETYPFKNFIPKGATHLVLGSFPTHRRNWKFEAHYPGRANFFWRMLSEIYNYPLNHSKGPEAANERHALCTAKGIALSDTIYKVRRKVAMSSKDSDLEVVEKMDIAGLLRKHPSIHTIILTGSSGKVSALSVLREHLKEQQIPLNLNETKPVTGTFYIEKRLIEVFVLYSTSGLNIGRYSEAVEQYRNCLPK